jgi:hypothetical protein
MQEQKTPRKLGLPVNYKVIAVLIGSTIIYQIFNSIYGTHGSDMDFFMLLYTTSLGVTTVYSFTVARRYWGSEVFGKAYLSLAIAYACFFIGNDNGIIIQPF